MRGNRPACKGINLDGRSIPACAGEPDWNWRLSYYEWVYPRVCGGTRLLPRLAILMFGLSPRVRGNRAVLRHMAGQGGSIPACAGEPESFSRRADHSGVYPRVCGGTSRHARLRSRCGGLSPRVRGNRHISHSTIPSRWSIPACAGEPGLNLSAAVFIGVYPRVCGGTTH